MNGHFDDVNYGLWDIDHDGQVLVIVALPTYNHIDTSLNGS